MSSTINAPEFMPVLSPGKHRNPRRGACFMEMASFLAGERWSDHPACTQPLLAELARLVNDSLTDQWRPRLIPLIPSVVGLTSDDLHVDATIALRSASAALPIAATPRQNVLATAVIRCERLLAELDGRHRDWMSPQSRQVLDQVPQAAAWARSFSNGTPISPRTFRAKTAPRILGIAVESISLACAPDVEQRLVELLAATIADCHALIPTEAAQEQAHSRRSGAPAAPTSLGFSTTGGTAHRLVRTDQRPGIGELPNR
jgi:hypothetical protein